MMGEIEEIIVVFFGIYVFSSKKKKSREKETYLDIIICRSLL